MTNPVNEVIKQIVKLVQKRNSATTMSKDVPVNHARILSHRLEAISTEYQICRRKLESKNEALLIMNKELDQCRSERDQFKLMAEQVRDRYQMLKRQLSGDSPMSPSHVTSVDLDPKAFSDTQSQGLAKHLYETKETNKALQFEVDDLKQKLQDAGGDIKLLREQIARSRVGTTDEGLNTRHFPAHERVDLVEQLEKRREEYVQLERDLQQVLDEKEELETARDAYRTKNERINMELNFILGGDERRIVDVDALNMENKYLNDRLKQMEEEKTMAIETVSKYKSILEKKNSKGVSKLGQSRSGGLVITQKQVQEIVQHKIVAPNPYILADLQSLCTTLLDTINDKNLALSHQRKTNKLLGNRVNELEKKLKTLEVSGLWSHNVSANQQNNLEKLISECEEIKTLVPRRMSQSTDASEAPCLSDFSVGSMSEPSSAKSSPSHLPHLPYLPPLPHLPQSGLGNLSRLDIEELDTQTSDEGATKGKHQDQNGDTKGESLAANRGRSPEVSKVTSPHCNSPAKLLDSNSELSSMKAFEALEETWQPSTRKSDRLKKDRRSSDTNTNDIKTSDTHRETDDSDSPAKNKKKSIFDDDSDLEESFISSVGDVDQHGFNDDNNEDRPSELEATEEFNSLMASVTSKLLKASHDMNSEASDSNRAVNRSSLDEDSEVFGCADRDSSPLLDSGETNLDNETLDPEVRQNLEDRSDGDGYNDFDDDDVDEGCKKSLLNGGNDEEKSDETLMC